MNINIYQIFYDDNSKNVLDHGFIPLDNSKNLRPDWYELHPIREFFLRESLVEEDWYGFFSPKFSHKTGLDSSQVKEFIEYSEGKADVALISYAWDQIAYFKNPFEQGEKWHPGITDACQSIVKYLNYDIDLRTTVYHSGNFTFCNYIVAKPKYWREWLGMADKLYSMSEKDGGEIYNFLSIGMKRGSIHNGAPMKAFIQERLPFLLILKNGFRTSVYDEGASAPIFAKLFSNDSNTRTNLQACDLLKGKYLASGDYRYFEEFLNRRKLIALRF